jgi:peptidyl-prolyl cis-trans isomerase A (cyclophilin A)
MVSAIPPEVIYLRGLEPILEATMSSSRTLPLVLFLLLALVGACKKEQPAPGQQGGAAEAQQQEQLGGEPAKNPLLEPLRLKQKAPESYKVRFDTTKGPFVVEVERELAPRGADRFYNLVKNGFFNDARFFRVVPGFVVQFGIPADPEVATAWRTATILDDKVKGSNTKGTITFATSGPDSRTTQVFINYADNSRLDRMGFAPFGKVVEGMDVVESINSEYGERPNQGAVQTQGNAYLDKEFPKLDSIRSAKIVE